MQTRNSNTKSKDNKKSVKNTKKKKDEEYTINIIKSI